MTDEVITEDTPDNGVEMFQYKLDLLKAANENLKTELELAKLNLNRCLSNCNVYEERISRLVNNMTVRQLKNIGAKVNITFSNEDEDYD
jgi:hypothetical protein